MHADRYREIAGFDQISANQLHIISSVNRGLLHACMKILNPKIVGGSTSQMNRQCHNRFFCKHPRHAHCRACRDTHSRYALQRNALTAEHLEVIPTSLYSCASAHSFKHKTISGQEQPDYHTAFSNRGSATGTRRDVDVGSKSNLAPSLSCIKSTCRVATFRTFVTIAICPVRFDSRPSRPSRATRIALLHSLLLPHTSPQHPVLYLPSAFACRTATLSYQTGFLSRAVVLAMPHSPPLLPDLFQVPTESCDAFCNDADLQPECEHFDFHDLIVEASVCPPQDPLADFTQQPEVQQQCPRHSRNAMTEDDHLDMQSRIASETIGLLQTLSHSSRQPMGSMSFHLQDALSAAHDCGRVISDGPPSNFAAPATAAAALFGNVDSGTHPIFWNKQASQNIFPESLFTNSSVNSDLGACTEGSTTSNSDDQRNTGHSFRRACFSASTSPASTFKTKKLGVRNRLSEEERIAERRRKNRVASSRSYYNRKARVERLEMTLRNEKRKVTTLFKKELDLRKESAILKARFIAEYNHILPSAEKFSSKSCG